MQLKPTIEYGFIAIRIAKTQSAITSAGEDEKQALLVECKTVQIPLENILAVSYKCTLII